MRNATKKASVAIPAPKILAINTSRKKPRMRETKVMLLIVASALSRFMGMYINLVCLLSAFEIDKETKFIFAL